MKCQNKPLSNAEIDIAWAVAQGKNQRDAGAVGGRTERTVRRLISRPDFQAVVDHLRLERLLATLQAAQSLESPAVETIRDLLGADQPPTVRLRAATTALSHVHAVREEAQILLRLIDLEAAVERTALEG